MSYDGFMSLNGISGGEDINFRVTEEDAVIAPYWTSRNGNQSCWNGTVETHHVSESVDNATFTAIKQAVLDQYKLSDEFRPREAIFTTWREIPDNNPHHKVSRHA